MKRMYFPAKYKDHLIFKEHIKTEAEQHSKIKMR